MILTKIILIIVLIYIIFKLLTENVTDLLVTNSKPIINNSKIKTTIQFKNINKQTDLFIVDLSVKPIFSDSIENINYKLNLTSIFNKKLVYWKTQVLLPSESIDLNIELDIENIKDVGKNFSIDINYVPYGHMQNNKSIKYYQIVIPLEDKNSIKNIQKNINWKKLNNNELLSIRTPILTNSDNLVNILNDYVKEFYQKDDILCIAESAVAILQNRYVYHGNLEISFLAKILSRIPNHLSSLATPGGFQTLINEIGIFKIIYSGIIAFFFKILRIKGYFYKLVGNQAKLIDDISGTLAPYDKSIVLGPNNLKTLINDVYQKTKIKIAIVDVNDIKKVDIIGCHSDCDKEFIKSMLIDNPSGNSDEQTPLTLIRKII